MNRAGRKRPDCWGATAWVALAIASWGCTRLEPIPGPFRTTPERAMEIDRAVRERCEQLVSDLGPGWKLVACPRGAVVNAESYADLGWVFTGQEVAVDCHETRRVAIVLDDAAGQEPSATLMDVTDPADMAECCARGLGYDMTTVPSEVPDGRVVEQRLYLFLLVGTCAGERQRVAIGWCQAWRRCPEQESTEVSSESERGA